MASKSLCPQFWLDGGIQTYSSQGRRWHQARLGAAKSKSAQCSSVVKLCSRHCTSLISPTKALMKYSNSRQPELDRSGAHCCLQCDRLIYVTVSKRGILTMLLCAKKSDFQNLNGSLLKSIELFCFVPPSPTLHSQVITDPAESFSPQLVQLCWKRPLRGGLLDLTRFSD